MEREFNELLAGQFVNDEKANMTINEHSIDIMEIDEDGFNGYGKKFYSAHEAYDFLKNNGCLI